MCIVVYKPQNVALPKKSRLQTCFNSNSHGAGYMFSTGECVYIRKGFMTFDDFYTALKKDYDSIGKKQSFVMHFRISTQGGVNANLCHPYPLADNYADMQTLRVKCGLGIAHNGIISLTSEYDSYWDSKAKCYVSRKLDHNDTMKFIKDYLYLIIRDTEYYKDANTLKLIERLCGSKLAIMDGTGHVQLIGEYIADEDGCYYSNSAYLPKTYTYSYNDYEYGKTTKNKNWLDWEDYYNYATDEYDFDKKNCPLSVEGDYTYCAYCKNVLTCQNRTCKTKKK